MTYLLRLKNPVLDKLADDCGVIITNENREVTASEIEFLLEQVVKECSRALKEKAFEYDLAGGRQVAAQTMDTAASLLLKKFGLPT